MNDMHVLHAVTQLQGSEDLGLQVTGAPTAHILKDHA